MLEKKFSSEQELQKKLFYILAIASCVVSVFGFLLNLFKYGNVFPAWVCLGCGLAIIICSLFGIASRLRKYAIAGMLIIVIWIEFPILYYIHGEVILLYFALSIFGIVAFMPQRFSLPFSIATIIWDACVIVCRHYYPREFQPVSETRALVFKMCTYLLVTISFLVITYMVIQAYERQKGELFSMNEQLYFAATHDPLTQLYNREYLMKEIDERMQSDEPKFMVVMLDIDNFKGVNDTYGHSFGDKVLVQFARFMKSEVGDKGFASRYGGEEFMIVFDHNNQTDALRTLHNISEQLEAYFLEEKQVALTFSGGLEVYRMGQRRDALIKHADNKLYEAKRNGKNQVVYKEIKR